jgi:hypothetical protein
LQSAFKFQPDPSVVALLNCLEFLKPDEAPALLKLIEPLMGNTVLKANLSKFCRYVEDKAKLIEFMGLESVARWRDRMRLMKQCIEFIPFLGCSLVQKAIEFADDEVAIVRNESVHFWVALIRACPEVAKEVSRLMDRKWQTRLVAAKIIGAVGVIDDFADLATVLSGDEIFNVRFAMAYAVQGSDWLAKLFPDSQDVEIRELF